MKKHIIDLEKLVTTFQLPLDLGSVKEKHPQGIYEQFGQYIFRLRNTRKEKVSIFLVFDDSMPRDVQLRIEGLNGLESIIDFSKITKVKYIPEYRAVVFESHTKTHFSVLQLYWRGQFDLNMNIPKKYYKKSVWAQTKNQLPEVKPH